MANLSSNLSDPLAFILQDFSVGLDQDVNQIDPNAFYCVPITTFAIPELALYVLVKKLNCYHYDPYDSPFDKVHWGVVFRYEDKSYALELRKFGLRLIGSLAPPTEEEANVILSPLSKAAQWVEKEVRTLAQQRISEGCATVPNRLAEFNDAFEFFAKKAEETYAHFKTQQQQEFDQQEFDQQDFSRLLDSSVIEKEASYYASAAIEAFYSRLEHILILVRPFVKPRLSGNEIINFMSSGWADKFKPTLSVASNQQANQILSTLTKTKEKYRNPGAHGGFVKKGTALYFHDSLMGAQPVVLSKKDELPVLTLCGITENDFYTALKDFGKFDQFLQKSEARYGYLYAKSGLDVAYDDDSINEYLQHSSSDEDFDNFLEAALEWEDSVVNADYL